MIDSLNIGSSYYIKVSRDTHRFMYYFLAFATCIKGFAHMRMIVEIEDTHLHGKNKDMFNKHCCIKYGEPCLSIAFCFVDKDNDASCTFFFEKLKETVVDESHLYLISDRHKSIFNGIAKIYNHDQNGYCMRHLGENLLVNHHCGDSFILYYNATKT